MLKMQSNLKTISDARPADATSEKDNKEDDEDEDDPQLFGQAKSAMQVAFGTYNIISTSSNFKKFS